LSKEADKNKEGRKIEGGRLKEEKRLQEAMGNRLADCNQK